MFETWTSPISIRLVSDIYRSIKTIKIILMLVWEITDLYLFSYEQLVWEINVKNQSTIAL